MVLVSPMASDEAFVMPPISILCKLDHMPSRTPVRAIRAADENDRLLPDLYNGIGAKARGRGMFHWYPLPDKPSTERRIMQNTITNQKMNTVSRERVRACLTEVDLRSIPERPFACYCHAVDPSAGGLGADQRRFDRNGLRYETDLWPHSGHAHGGRPPNACQNCDRPRRNAVGYRR